MVVAAAAAAAGAAVIDSGSSFYFPTLTVDHLENSTPFFLVSLFFG